MRSIKRNAVLVTVMLFICAAVYLNWSYNKEVEEAAGAGKEEDVSVLGGEDSGGLTAGTLADEGGAGLFYTVSGAQNTGAAEPADAADEADAAENPYADYFADVRLQRAEARDEAAATLSAVATADGASQETVDGALKAMTELAERAMKESEIESKIKAKGFIDCVVYLSDDHASVTVACEGGLTNSSVARITDIIVSETDLTADKLTVTEIK